MAHPLLCWDIVMEGTARRIEFAKDITALQSIMKTNKWNLLLDNPVSNSIIWENKTIVITNTDLKIVLVTKNIYEMNGYRPHEVIGRQPNMFQGKETTIESKMNIKKAIEKRLPFVIDIINYRKDGTLYTCQIEGYPVFDKDGKLVNFIALENAA